jgi:flagellar biosynthesis regulator FlaF
MWAFICFATTSYIHNMVQMILWGAIILISIWVLAIQNRLKQGSKEVCSLFSVLSSIVALCSLVPAKT